MKAMVLFRRSFRFALLLGCFAALTACSSVTKREAMFVELPAESYVRHSESIALMVVGEPRGIHIGNFKDALAKSIRTSGIFADVDNSGAAPYLLNVEFKHVDRPMFGGSFTINIDTVWTLYRASDRETLMMESVKSTYVGGWEGGFVGVNRARAATEGSARENIRLGLEKLGKLELIKEN